MKTPSILLFMLFNSLMFSQEHTGRLLLLRIDIHQDIEIEQDLFNYMAIEVNEKGEPKGNMAHVFFDSFTDSHISQCVEKDSLRIATLRKGETFQHENTSAFANLKLVTDNISKMKSLLTVDVKSSLYNEKVKIVYSLITARYCKTVIANRDSQMLNVTGDVILILDNLEFDIGYKIPKTLLHDYIKALDFNKILY